MSDIVTFADDVALFLLDEGGVVLCEGNQNVYGLNTTATFIWCCCEEGMTTAEIAASATRTFGISPAEAETYTQNIVEEWRSLGLLDGAGRPEIRTPAKAKAEETKAPGSTPSKPAPSEIHSERTYRILGQVFRVR